MLGGIVPSDGIALPSSWPFAMMAEFPKVYVTGGPGVIALSTGAESVVLTANIATIGPNGRLFLAASCNVGFGSTLLGTNGSRLRLYVDGVQVPGAEKLDQSTATLAVTISFDANPSQLFGYVEGLTPGLHTIEFRAIKLGGVSTANVSGERNLFVVEFP